MRPYKDTFRNNLAILMLSCGFEDVTVIYSSMLSIITVKIFFPAAARAPAAVPQTLDVDDEFTGTV
ncbi:hypothetical protein DFH09DRAFT_1369145 [Mycena vulgaris]|nr:hypothetical protein DFH09DRAFT_1369145 [Mycena vulgaris]